MDLSKQLEFLNPAEFNNEEIHIIGTGAIGSTVAIQLARMGFENITLWDKDVVEAKNVCNQTFNQTQIGQPKVQALKNAIKEINPNADVTALNRWWTEDCVVTGYVFLCVDSIELRKKIVETYNGDEEVKAFFDFRMGLTDAQHYAATNTENEIKPLLRSMQFTDEEAKEQMPVSACGSTLSVRPTVTAIVALGLANFANVLKEQPHHKCIIFDTFKPSLLAM